MNDQVQNAQPQAVEVTKEQAAKLAALAQKLETEGEVFVQTDENVGSERKLPKSQTLH